MASTGPGSAHSNLNEFHRIQRSFEYCGNRILISSHCSFKQTHLIVQTTKSWSYENTIQCMSKRFNLHQSQYKLFLSQWQSWLVTRPGTPKNARQLEGFPAKTVHSNTKTCSRYPLCLDSSHRMSWTYTQADHQGHIHSVISWTNFTKRSVIQLRWWWRPHCDAHGVAWLRPWLLDGVND